MTKAFEHWRWRLISTLSSVLALSDTVMYRVLGRVFCIGFTCNYGSTRNHFAHNSFTWRILQYRRGEIIKSAVCRDASSLFRSLRDSVDPWIPVLSFSFPEDESFARLNPLLRDVIILWKKDGWTPRPAAARCTSVYYFGRRRRSGSLWQGFDS